MFGLEKYTKHLDSQLGTACLKNKANYFLPVAFHSAKNSALSAPQN